MDTLDPKDLARFQSAQREAAEAQKAAADAQVRAVAARGAVDFLSRHLTLEYQLTPADTVHLETGVITRAQPVTEPPQE